MEARPGRMPVEPRPAVGRGGGPLRGKGALAVGLVLAGTGVAGLARLDTSNDREAAVALSIVFVAAGLAYVRHALRTGREARRVRTVAEERPGVPWLADHPWRIEGALDESGDEGKELVATGLRILGFAAAIQYGLVMVARHRADEPLAVAVMAFGAVPVLGMAGGAIWAIASGAAKVRRRRVHGPTELRYRGFPFLVGGALDAELVRDPEAPPLASVEATLRCVQEVWVRSRRGRRSLRHDVLHEETRTFPAAGARGRFVIRFELPADPALGSALAGNPPRYWELTVRGDSPRALFAAKFLVPVYARPDAPAAGERARAAASP